MTCRPPRPISPGAPAPCKRARERGEILLAGALAEPADRALIVFRAADKSKAEAFARKDPYVMNGLVKKWEVRPWNVVVGNEQPASTASFAPLSGAILRRWSARTTEAQLPKYLEHFSKNVLPALRGVHGYLGATSLFAMMKRSRKRRRDHLAFPRFYPRLRRLRPRSRSRGPEAAALLTSFDRRARHSEIVLTDRV